jgi:uncharacterized coiled-coil DUF342 family protein
MELLFLIIIICLVLAFLWREHYLNKHIQELKNKNKSRSISIHSSRETIKYWQDKAHKYKSELLKCEKELDKYKYRPRDENGRWIKAS